MHWLKPFNSDANVIAHRISGNWNPATTAFEELLSEQSTQTDHSNPTAFYLAYALEGSLPDLGDAADWQAEWKWDGIRGQVIKRNDQLFVWSRGEDLITEKFPEYHHFAEQAARTVLLSMAKYYLTKTDRYSISTYCKPALAARILPKNICRKRRLVCLLTTCLELNGEDIRHLALSERRAELEKLVYSLQLPWLQLSPVVAFNNWDELTTQREQRPVTSTVRD